MSVTYHLFISHSWNYSDKYDGLVNLLQEEPVFQFDNFSVPKDDPVHTNGTDAELYAAIKQKIACSTIVLVLAGVYSSYSKWIQNELYIAKKEFYIPRPIIAIQPWGAERTSTVVNDAADTVVGWNTKSIISAIRELA